MSDVEDNTPQEEIWEDTVDVEEIPNGPTTIFVGGFSKYKSINEALEVVQTANDRIVVLEQQDGDVTIDTTRFCGVTIISAIPRNTLEAPKITGEDDEAAAEEEELDEEELLRRQKAARVKKDTTTANITVTGKLVLQFTEPNDNTKLPTGFPEVEEGEEGTKSGEGEDGEEGEDASGNLNEDEDGVPKVVPRPPALNINGLNFTNGVVTEAQTHAYLEDCAFGTSAFQPNTPANANVNDINTKVNALSTVEFTRCQLYGSNKAAIYCFPHSRAVFKDCDVHGAKMPPTAEEIAAENAKKPRGYVAPPPAAPAVPTSVCCATGIISADSSCSFNNVDVSNVGIGIYALGSNKNLKVESSAVKQCETVGILFDNGCNGLVKDVTVTLCGRECGVFGAGHPTVRGCTFVGDVRLKKSCEATGITDNILALNHVVINEDTQFHLKGFTQIAHDPTAPKKAKGSPKQ